ncbi:NADAR family protein [Nonomuraea zeae]|uniref:NADAR family protein n=1 Tax=Nonomuraea zeae TaxID=1642303 RepID=UPI001478158F|nr:NADAR family protein [Nonomuraea zeae]
MPRNALLEEQPSLWSEGTPGPADMPPQVHTHLERPHGHPRPPRRDQEWNELTACAPECLACGEPEPPAEAPAWPLCPATRGRCATICAHTADAYKAEVCLITTRVHAELMTLPFSGRTVAAVTCPFCGLPHAHDPAPGQRYRVSRCRTGRKPYILHIPHQEPSMATITRQVIDDFRGEYEALSNFAPIPVAIYSTLEGREIVYSTGEHAFNAAKTTDPAERAAIAAAPSPGEAKRIGRGVALRPGWDERIRYAAMRMVLKAKFAPSSPAAAVLLSTGNALLVEGNRWHDQHWGDCYCGRASCEGSGANHLGRMLMQRRTELREAVL